MDVHAELEQGRDAYRRRSWSDAYAALRAADEITALAADDLELLATSAYMLGKEDDYFHALERAHRAHEEAREGRRAARCAFWIGMQAAQKGELARASGWLRRSHRIVEQEGEDCVEQGYLAIPTVLRSQAAGDWEEAARAARSAAATGQRFGDRDLFALAVHAHGHMLLRLGRRDEGLALLDEAMVAATAGELSPIVTGIVYCGAILACQEAHEPQRAQEWTAALTSWCRQQPDMVAFTGRCLLHRAEIVQLHGGWEQALAEARRAVERSARVDNRAAAGEACYRQAEVHRLRGEQAAAEELYREASRWGREPQPGLALLRMAQGDCEAAATAIRRATSETSDAPARAALLPAFVEIMVACRELDEAAAACADLEELSRSRGSRMLEALAAAARGSVALAQGDAQTGLVALRDSWRAWEKLEAPYEAARSRALLGRACRALGDEGSAELELAAAHDTFTRLGAAPDLARVDALRSEPTPDLGHGLTARELEVLRHVAAGRTNREIAAALVISEHTVARHVQNIFAKIGVSSRTAAGAYAFEHELV